MNNTVKKGLLRAAVVGATGAVTAAQAAIDTAAIVSAITDAGVAAGVVGAAYLVAVMGIRAFKMIKQAM